MPVQLLNLDAGVLSLTLTCEGEDEQQDRHEQDHSGDDAVDNAYENSSAYAKASKHLHEPGAYVNTFTVQRLAQVVS